MKKNLPALITGIVLLVIFLLLLFTFQVRQTEAAVVTRFGRVDRAYTDQPGFKLRLPWPIEKVYKLENRVQSFERKFEQTLTRDQRPLLVTVFVGWRIGNAQTFLERFDKGDFAAAENQLENLVRNTKNGVLGKYLFSDLISTNPEQLKFDQIETEMLTAISAQAGADYGIEVKLLGIKQLGLPEVVTQAVFDRMRAERNAEATAEKSIGDREATKIRAEARRKSEEIISQASAKEVEILGQAEAEAAKHLQVFDQNPDLAILLLRLRAIEAALKDRTTLILDQQTPPFDMLQKKAAPPAQGAAGSR
jgi:modulator of FtsH protease HflC